jgi:ribonuclease VapC
VTSLVVDTSAAVAILTDEKGAEDLVDQIANAAACFMSAATLVELGIVMEARLGPAGAGIVERFLRDSHIDVVAVDRSQVDRALEGWRQFGKGRHPAGLNYGDCFSYALAVDTGNPLLCVGDDFPPTDVDVVQPG